MENQLRYTAGDEKPLQTVNNDDATFIGGIKSLGL
jgi:hypothetical protein